MNSVVLQQPGTIVFGENSIQQLAECRFITSSEQILMLVATPLLGALAPSVEAIKASGKKVELVEYNSIPHSEGKAKRVIDLRDCE